MQGYLNLTGSEPHAALRLELAEERGVQCQEGLMFPNRDLGLWPTVVPLHIEGGVDREREGLLFRLKWLQARCLPLSFLLYITQLSTE